MTDLKNGDRKMYYKSLPEITITDSVTYEVSNGSTVDLRKMSNLSGVQVRFNNGEWQTFCHRTIDAWTSDFVDICKLFNVEIQEVV